MALTEEQVQRYSRQILLAEVGGVGQERLLGFAVGLMDGGGPQDALAAYLGSGGSPVPADHTSSERRVGPADVGFLLSASRVGELWDPSLYAQVEDLNLDAATPDEPLALAAGPGASAVKEGLPGVAWGGRGGRGTLVYRTAGGCAACFGLTARDASESPPPALDVLVGALGALALQRVALGWSEPLGALEVGLDGSVRPGAIHRCERHGP